MAVPFHLHTSNRLDRLAGRLADVMRQPLASPFTPETIVVQSLGMARWLKLELARRLGVCGHVEFPFPRAFADRLFQAQLSVGPEPAALSREVVQWRLFRLLADLPDTELFDVPRRYLVDKDPRKRLQLATRLANLFDQYLVFRPDFLTAWENGAPAALPSGQPLPHPADPWQAELWRRVVIEAAGPHPAHLHAELIAALAKTPPENMPARVALFGISGLPPFYLQLFGALAAHLEIHCFVLQPCAEWWGDISTGRESERTLRRLGRRAGDAEEVHLEPGHRLLGSLGTLGRDFLKLIYEHTDPIEHEDFAGPAGSSLLHQLQRDLLELSNAGSGMKRPIAADDDSIRLHVCHSPVRELEVLHDHLLDWFQRDPTLTPRDVLVMTPDLAAYAPLIQAIFDAPQTEDQRIPYSLADRGPRQNGHIAETFLRLLRLAHGRLGVTSVLDLLECSALRTRFGLLESDLPMLRHWVADTRIHWGRDEAHRDSLGLPATSRNTWRAGLQRLLLGYAMAGNETELFAGLLPYPDIEGGPAELLGRFAEFAEQLFGNLTQLEHPKTSNNWTQLFLGLVDEFFTGDRETADELAELRQSITGLGRQLATAKVTEPLALAALLEPLAAALENDTSGAGYLTGGVTFCALKPMRSIPFRVICLLGMNDGAFPRQAPHLSFDLMAAAPRLGDRSTRDDDRYLFLETLVSARDRLHLSHVGQSQRDNRPIPPSVVISELLDHLDTAFTVGNNDGRVSDTCVVVKHRLHAFSPDYFATDSNRPLFSYSRENSATAASVRAGRLGVVPFLAQPLAEPGLERRHVTLKQLADFLSHPAKFFLRDRLGIELPRAAEILDDEEPLSLDARESYALKQDLVAWQLADEDPTVLGKLLAAQGRLPHGQPGVLDFHTLRNTADRFRQRLGDTAAGEPIPVDLTVDGFQLTGQITPRSDGSLLHYRCAKLKATDLLRLWIEHLVWNLTGSHEVESWKSEIIAEDATVRFLPVPEAEKHIRELLGLYWEGLRRPLPFFPRTAHALVEAEQKLAGGKSKAKTSPLEQARPKWLGSERQPLPGERDDAWIELCFRHESDPLTEEFQTLARAVFGPLLAHSEREEV